MKTFFSAIEWYFGLGSILFCGFVYIIFIFMGGPKLAERLSSTQQFAFSLQAYILYGVVGIVGGSFILQFFLKEFPFRHLAGATGFLAAGFYFVLLLSVFSSVGSSQTADKYYTDAKDINFIEEVQKGNVSQVQKALASGQSVNIEGKDGYRPIHFAIKAKNQKMLQTLLQAGADANTTDSQGRPVLFTAMKISGNVEIVETLLKAGANPNAERSNSSALLSAVEIFDYGVAAALLKAGADPLYVSKDGKSSVVDDLCKGLQRSRPDYGDNKAYVQDILKELEKKNVKLPCAEALERWK